MTKPLTTEQLKALGQAAKAYNMCVKLSDESMIALARGIFGLVLDHVIPKKSK